MTKQVARPKIDGLYKYIQNENKKGKKIFQGTVTNTDPRNYKGVNLLIFSSATSSRK